MIKIICFPLCLHMAPPRPFQTVRSVHVTPVRPQGFSRLLLRYIGIEIAHIVTWCIVICATLKLVPCIYTHTCIHSKTYTQTYMSHKYSYICIPTHNKTGKQINHVYITKCHNSDLLLSNGVNKVFEVFVVAELGLGYEVVELNKRAGDIVGL